MEKDTAILIVKILAVLAYIDAAVTLLAGLALILGGSVFGGIVGAMIPMSGILVGSMLSGLFVLLGIVAIALAVLDYFIGRGLWNHENWARILVIVLSVLSLFNWYGGTIIGALLIYFFGFDKTAVALFKGGAKKPAKRSRR